MILKIDFNSDEALYIQLRNQIVVGIATSQLSVGDPLPSVRQLADTISINYAYSEQGMLGSKAGRVCKTGYGKGAVIAIDYDKVLASIRCTRRCKLFLQKLFAGI